MEKEIKDLQEKLDALKLRYEQCKQPFKNGDVIKHITGTAILLITDLEKGQAYCINNDKWTNTSNFNFNIRPWEWQLVTSEEWLEALTKEAVKRGLVHGAKINNSNVLKRTNIIDFIIPNNRVYKLESNYLFSFSTNDSYYTLMENGIWANLITPKEETLEELVSNGTFKLD